MKKRVLFWTGVILGGLILLFGLHQAWLWISTEGELIPVKKSYRHHEFVEVSLRIQNRKLLKKLKGQTLNATVLYQGNPVTTIGDVRSIALYFDEKENTWRGKWPCPWNAPNGKYHLALAVAEKARIRAKPFRIEKREPAPLSPGLGILTLESDFPLRKWKMQDSAGALTDWRGIFDWASYVGADALWFLATHTRGEGNLDERFPWAMENLSLLPEMGRQAHERGLKFGAYILCYITSGKKRFANTQYALEINPETQAIYKTKSISLNDEKRLHDIIQMVKILNDIPEIDFIGLDYLRNALGGLELVDDFVREMRPRVSRHFWEWSSEKRKLWLSYEWRSRRNMRLIDQWQWWRAHRVGKIVEKIRKEVPLKKPLWVFTLTWEKGWQHGQDPIMLNDAGVDIDALMLYEADKGQFERILSDWHAYARKDSVQIVAGNVIDWNLHQMTLSPTGPEEFYDRMMRAVEGIYADGLARGIFLHDLARALWGRRGPYSTKEWMLVGASAITELKRKWGLLPLEVRLHLPKTLALGGKIPVKIEIQNLSRQSLTDINLSLFVSEGLNLEGPFALSVNDLAPGKSLEKSVTLRASRNVWERRNRVMLACRASYKGHPNINLSTAFGYLNILSRSRAITLGAIPQQSQPPETRFSTASVQSSSPSLQPEESP